MAAQRYNANPVADIFTLRTHVSFQVAKGDIYSTQEGERGFHKARSLGYTYAKKAKNESLLLLSYPAFLQKSQISPFSYDDLAAPSLLRNLSAGRSGADP